MYTGELPEAIADMQALLGEAENGRAERSLEREIRGTLAGAQYYAGWLMRLVFCYFLPELIYEFLNRLHG